MLFLRELNLDFVINARTCVYWLNVVDDEKKLKIAYERSNAFIEAGADCVFIPGAIDEATVSKLVKGINSLINIILNGVFNDFERLEKMGVRRLSVGSTPVRYVYCKTIELANNLYNGDVGEVLSNDFTYAKANDYFDKIKKKEEKYVRRMNSNSEIIMYLTEDGLKKN